MLRWSPVFTGMLSRSQAWRGAHRLRCSEEEKEEEEESEVWAQAKACRGAHRHASVLAGMPGRSQATVAIAH